jgi:hypothetical protein
MVHGATHVHTPSLSQRVGPNVTWWTLVRVASGDGLPVQQRFRAAIDRTEHCLAVAGRVEQVRLLVDYQGWAEVDLGQAVADEGQFGNDASCVRSSWVQSKTRSPSE